MKDEYVTVEHLRLSLTDLNHSATSEILSDAGVTSEHLTGAIDKIRGGQRVIDQDPESKYQALEQHSRDLTELARQGVLDPVIGRDDEIRRLMKVLSRRTKNNPVLIGSNIRRCHTFPSAIKKVLPRPKGY